MHMLSGRLLLWITFLLSCLLFAGCTTTPPSDPFKVEESHEERLALTASAQAFEQTLGWAPTDNFHVYSDKQAAYRQCRFTQEFSLTIEYLEPGQPCSTLMAISDTHEYDAEALATIQTPLLPLLARAPLTRFLNVVFHEDFHEQVTGIPTHDLNESATTLMGLLGALEYARVQYGEDSDTTKAFASDIEGHLASSRLLLQYYAELNRLYDQVSAKSISIESARTEKARLFAEMKTTCKDIVLVTINPCSNIKNNALLSFQYLYAVHYPMFYDLYVACGKDTKRTGQLIMRHADERIHESIFILRIGDHIANRCTQ